MTIEFENLELDLDMRIIKGDPPSDDRLYPGTPDAYEFVSLYAFRSIDKVCIDVSELWNLLDNKVKEKLTEQWAEKQ